MRIKHQYRMPLIVIGIILAIVLAPTVLQANTGYSGGWEVGTDLNSIVVSGSTYNIGGTRPTGALSWSSKHIHFDPDESKHGLPDLDIELSSPREYVNVLGEWTPAIGGMVFDNLGPKIVDDMVYFWDHHVFFFEVKATATADFENINGIIYGEANGMHLAKEAEITIYISFEVDEWINEIVTGFNTETATYALDTTTVWSGIMSASVAESPEAGYTNFDPIDSNGVSGIIKTHQSGALGMWASTPQEAPIGGISGIPKTITMELSGELLCGWKWPVASTIATAGVYFTYRVRVDVISFAGYHLETGKQDDNLKKDTHIEDTVDHIANIQKSLNDLVNALGPMLAMVMVIAVAIGIAVVVIQFGGIFRRR